MKHASIIAAVLAVSAFGQTCVAQTAAEKYRAVYMMAGYFLRAGNVCQEGAKELINTGFAFVSSKEIKAISQSFKGLSEQWMTEGASHFNDDVMQGGLSPACAKATDTSRRAQKAGVAPASK